MRCLESLGAAIEQHVGWIHHTAATSAPGGGQAWDALLRHYGIAAFAYEERVLSVQCLRLQRGALPSEVRAVFSGLKAWAEGELSSLQGDPASASRLKERIGALVEIEIQRYEDAIGIPRQVAAAPAPIAGPSLDSIFANAQSTAKEVPWANVKYKQVGSLTCVYCGGPQEQPLDFMCKYCRRPIAGLTKPTV
jgi:hypothetical protein